MLNTSLRLGFRIRKSLPRLRRVLLMLAGAHSFRKGERLGFAGVWLRLYGMKKEAAPPSNHKTGNDNDN